MPRPVNARPDRVPEHLKWVREAIECGKTIRGWIAGKVYGCEGHFAPAFKPCHTAISGGKLVCPWCAIPQYAARRFQGYLPLYNERLAKIVICINLDCTVRCDAWNVLQPVVVGKGKLKTSPVVVNANEWSTIKPTGPHVRNCSQDITPWLFCVLWKQEGLQAYGEVDQRSSSQVPTEPTGGTIEVVAKRDKPVTIAQLRKLREAGMDRVATDLESLLPRASAGSEPSPNGKHKSPPKG